MPRLSSQADHPGGNRLLVVDDEEPLLLSLAAATRARGIETAVASSGAEALEKIADERYDVVVTDLRMPGLDGLELLRRMREAGLDTRVVIITGYATLEAAVDGLRLGAVDFLVKPFTVEEFLASVERALNGVGVQTPRRRTWDEVEEIYRLTHRQRIILQAFHATGKTNRELAESLCLSTHTVKSHLKAAFQKLKVSSRAQLLQALGRIDD